MAPTNRTYAPAWQAPVGAQDGDEWTNSDSGATAIWAGGRWTFPPASFGPTIITGNLTVTGQILAADGSEAAPSISFANEPSSGWYRAGTNDVRFSLGNTDYLRLQGGSLILRADNSLAWGSTTVATRDLFLARIAAGNLGLLNGANAQEFNIYGTTTGPKTLRLRHDGTNAIIGTNSGGGQLTFQNGGQAVAAQVNGNRFDVYGGGLLMMASRINAVQGADVASANNLVLGGDGNVFEITGTTQINLISNLSWQNGSVVTLLFAASVTVAHGQTTATTNITILLSGAANFSATAGDTLTLVLGEIGGTQAWREVCRTVI